MFALLLALAVTPTAVAADRADPYHAAAVKLLRSLIRPDDYPIEALDRNEEGTANVRVEVGRNGEVRDCAVEKTSGSAALDTQTCRLIWMRAKFRPAHDKAGRPVAATVRTQINWRIAQDPAPSEPWATRTVVTFSPGKAASCRVEVEGALKPDDVSKSTCPVDLGPIPPELSQLQGRSVELITEQVFDVGREPKLHIAANDMLMGRQLAELDIDPAGKLTSCKIIETAGDLPQGFPGLCTTLSKLWVSRRGPDGKSTAFRGYVVMGGYMHVASAEGPREDQTQK